MHFNRRFQLVVFTSVACLQIVLYFTFIHHMSNQSFEFKIFVTTIGAKHKSNRSADFYNQTPLKQELATSVANRNSKQKQKDISPEARNAASLLTRGGTKVPLNTSHITAQSNNRKRKSYVRSDAGNINVTRKKTHTGGLSNKSISQSSDNELKALGEIVDKWKSKLSKPKSSTIKHQEHKARTANKGDYKFGTRNTTEFLRIEERSFAKLPKTESHLLVPLKGPVSKEHSSPQEFVPIKRKNSTLSKSHKQSHKSGMVTHFSTEETSNPTRVTAHTQLGSTLPHNHSTLTQTHSSETWGKKTHHQHRLVEHLTSRLVNRTGTILSKTWKMSSEVALQLPQLENAKTHSYTGDLQMVQKSLNKDILSRAKFQRARIDQFCLQHGLPNSLPQDIFELNNTLKHLLYDDSRQLIFCYVPKNGCSNIKWMFLILSGAIPPSDFRNRPPETLLSQARSLASLSPEEIRYRLEHYYKVATVRQPMQRMLSAYRNKFESPVHAERIAHFPETTKIKILRSVRNISHQASWEDYSPFVANLSVTFGEFIHYISSLPFREYNEHFAPILTLCQPCALKYDFYANFKVLDYDIHALMSLFAIPHEYFPHRTSQNATDSYLTEKYFHEKVSQEEKDVLFSKLKLELSFYYSLYPEDSGYHKSLY